MKKAEVRVGEVYAVKVSDKVVPVRIEREHPAGGWLGTNQESGREVRVKTARHLRGAWRAPRAAKPDRTVKVGDRMLLSGAEVEVLEVDAAGDDAAATVKRLSDGQTISAVPLDDLKPATRQDKPPTRDTGARGEKKAEGEPKRAEGKVRGPRAKGVAQGAKLSGLDAAAKVLSEAGEPLDCKTIVERAVEKGYWKTDGKTPSATIYAGIIREIAKKGDQARFRKVARGKFELVS